MNKKSKIIILISSLLAILLMVGGIAFAIFMYSQTGTSQEFVMGDIWMKYTENNGLTLEEAMPGDEYSKYFEFSITGTNTYTKKDILYDISLVKGEVPAGKEESNRIIDKYLKFKLVSVEENTETIIFSDKTYDDLTNKRIHVETIPKGTTNYSKTYRLYMVISEELKIGNSSDSIISNEDFQSLFGSIKVNVTGDFNEKEMPLTAGETIIKAAQDKIATNSSCKTTVVEDGITYISGSAECIDFNYVWYSGKLWRITAINPDGTMKMITDGAITTIAYGRDYNFYTDEENTSYMYQWLNEDFLDTLYNYENIIVTDAIWNASPGNGAISSKLPIDGQEEVLVNSPVGLLNSYEYYKSYQNTNYGSGYLNIGYYWWLLNRYSTSSSRVWNVYSNGSGNDDSPGNTYGGRPVVNLKSGVQLEGGSGTASNPYRIKGDKEEAVANTTLINTRSSGEYVNFNEELYRIVGIENETTKIIKADYVKDGTTILTKEFASSSTFGSSIETGSDNYWDYYLNKTWLKAVDSTYNETNDTSSVLAKGTYYLGSVTNSNYSYKLSICASASNIVTTKECEKTTSTWNGYVGLPRYGEMFASQTRDYTYSNAKYMWLITPYSSNVWRVVSYGSGNNTGPGSTSGGRPIIHLKSEIVIKSGSGTKHDPFVVGLVTTE